MNTSTTTSGTSRPCTRCAAKPTLTQADIDRMVQQVTSMRGVSLVEAAIYEKRIALCRACKQFQYESTCMLCGCVMQVRARLADGKCPQKNW